MVHIFSSVLSQLLHLDSFVWNWGSNKFSTLTKKQNKPCKGPSMATSNELSARAAQFLCRDPESPSAQSFQELISKLVEK